MASMTISDETIKTIEKNSTCSNPDCEFGNMKIIFLNVTKQEGFDKYIDLQIHKKEGDTRFSVCYKLNETLKTSINTCNALLSASKTQCFKDLKSNYSKDISKDSFDTSIVNLADYKKEALTSNIYIDPKEKITLDKGGCFYVNLLNYDSRNVSKSVGEKFSIGYNTLELTTLETTNDVGNWAKIAVDSNGVVHIIHEDDTNGYLRYCNNSGGVWSCLNITTIYDIPSAYGDAIAIDSNNVVHVLFRGTSTCLGYGNNSGGSWSFDTTLACGDTMGDGAVSSLAIDKNNVVHLTYKSTNSGSKLIYGNNSGGVWKFVNTPDKWLQSVNQIVIDSSNTSHIIAQTTDGPPFRLVYLNYSAGTWFNKTINGTSTGSLYPSLDIGNNDILHTIFYSDDDGTGGLRYGNNSGGAWTFADIPAAPQYSLIYKSLRVDSRDIVHFITANATDLYACNNYNNAWACYPLSIANPTTAYADLAIKQGRRVDSVSDSNFFHFAYYDSANGDLVYANIAVNSSQTSPANNSYKNTNTLTFNCTSQFDLMPLKNVTAYVWNSSSLVNNSKTNTISGTSNSSLFSIILPRDDIYTWNCYSCIASGDCFFSDYNFTISTDTVYPQINITHPLNLTNTTNTQININYTRDDANLDTCWYTRNAGETNTTLSSCGNITGVTWYEGKNNITVWVNDTANNVNSSSITFTLDTVVPNVTISFPQNEENYADNNTISLNYTVAESTTVISSCWYNVYLTTPIMIAISNTTLATCANTTFSLPGGDYNYQLNFYANDSLNNINHTVTDFGIRTESPVVDLNYPTDNKYFNNGTNVYFNFTAVKDTGLSSCQLWGNWTGTWHKNYTWVSPTNNTMNWTLINITETTAKWNVWCNDTLDNEGWATNNYTFTIDLTYPLVAINSISPIVGTQTVNFNSSITEIHENNCFYSIYNSSGGIDGAYNNLTLSCENIKSTTIAMTDFGLYNLFIYANDSAGNLNYTNKTFTTSTHVGSGGGGSNPPQKSEVISIKQPREPILSVVALNITEQNNLSRAIIYAEIRRACLDEVPCILNNDQKIELILKLDSLDVILNMEELDIWIKSYNKEYLEVVKLLDSQINQYDLFTGIVQINTGNLIANPSRLDPFPPYFIMSSKNPVFHTRIKFNKIVNDSYLLEDSDSPLSINYNTTEATIVLNITDTSFASKVYTGTASFISLEGDVTFVPINLRVINLRNGFTIITGVIFLGIIALLAFFRKQIIKSFKLKKLNKQIERLKV